jgi:hypothetical protein
VHIIPLFLLFSAVLMSALPAHSAKALDALDMADWTIVLADDAIPSERYAAEEFQALFTEATGQQLPIIRAAQTPKHHVFIGHGQAMAASSVGFGVEDLGEEGLRIRIQQDNIAIAGGRPRGTLYGVYEFFERYLGVRFLTYNHTHVPQPQAALQIPCEEHTYQPPFSYRYSYYTATQTHPEFAARLRNNTVTQDAKLGGITQQRHINHTYYRHLPVAKYGAEHPEYFALINGERVLNAGGGGPEPCTTNPDVVRIVTEAVLDELRAHPDWKNVDVSQNDNDGYCQCERCAAINTREESPMGANLYLVNAVADAVAREFPGVKVGTLSYWYTRKPPKFMKPRDNVQIQLCSIEACTIYALDDPRSSKNIDFARDFVEWGKICDDMWIWNYNTNFSAYNLPFPNLRAIGPNLRFFQRNNGKGVFMQGNSSGGPGEFSDLRNYVISRCLWDASLDSWALTEEFCRLHYGDSADLIIEYLTFIHDNALLDNIEPNCFADVDDLGITREVAEKIFDYFERALKAAESPLIHARVEQASICAYLAMIEAVGKLNVENDRLLLTFPDKYAGIVETYATLCRKYGVVAASETGPMELYLDHLQRHRTGIEAVTLQNEIWRLVILPENNGQIVAMRHKPSGRELLRGMSGTMIAGGKFEELAQRGMESETGHFTATLDGDAVVLTRTLQGGSTLKRAITLCPDGAETIRFQTVLSHQGTEPTEYEMKIRPEFDTGTRTTDSAVVAAYIQDGGDWKQYNQDWNVDHGPNDKLLAQVTGGGLAFFNHEEGFGVRQTYDPGQYDRPRLWWKGEWHQMNLELLTPRVMLHQGEKLSYGYEVEFLQKSPR